MPYPIHPGTFSRPGILLALAAAPLMAAPDDSGLAFNAAYTGDLLSNTSGGVQTGGTYLDNLDLQIAAERGSIFGIPGPLRPPVRPVQQRQRIQ